MFGKYQQFHLKYERLLRKNWDLIRFLVQIRIFNYIRLHRFQIHVFKKLSLVFNTPF